MSNHYHLVVDTDGNDLSAMMQGFQSGYARAFNARTDRTGHLFEERFTSVCITDSAQLSQTVRYVHRNPVVVTGTARVADYRWSSLAASIGLRSGPIWLRTDLLGQRMSLDGHLQYVQNAQPSDRLPVHWNPALRSTSLEELDWAVTSITTTRLRRVAIVTLADALRCAPLDEVADFLGVALKTVRNTRANGRALRSRDEDFDRLCERALQRLE